MLLQDFAYPYRMWITLHKLLYAPLRGISHRRIFILAEYYTYHCYSYYSGFPRRTLLGFSVNRGATRPY
jgi:hypothetical protein